MNWVSLVYSTTGKGLSIFIHLPMCSMSWIIIISFKICFKCWCFISKWKKAVLIIVLPFSWIKCSVCNSPVIWYNPKFDWFIKKISAIRIAIGHIISFKEVWYKNKAVLYSLTTFWEDSQKFLSFIPSMVVVISFFPLPYLRILISVLEGDGKVEIQALEKILDSKTIKCLIFFHWGRAIVNHINLIKSVMVSLMFPSFLFYTMTR